jgi:hypothetical protein
MTPSNDAGNFENPMPPANTMASVNNVVVTGRAMNGAEIFMRAPEDHTLDVIAAALARWPPRYRGRGRRWASRAMNGAAMFIWTPGNRCSLFAEVP